MKLQQLKVENGLFGALVDVQRIPVDVLRSNVENPRSHNCGQVTVATYPTKNAYYPHHVHWHCNVHSGSVIRETSNSERYGPVTIDMRG